MRPTFCRLALLALSFFGLPSVQGSSSPDAGGVPQARISPETVRVNVVEGDDIRFPRLSGVESLSQSRVAHIVQDNQGFMWFGTQYGVDRYDGYQFKIFKNDPAQPNSLCGVYMLSLFKDRSDQSYRRYTLIGQTHSGQVPSTGWTVSTCRLVGLRDTRRKMVSEAAR
jgi:hypothetical protein